MRFTNPAKSRTRREVTTCTTSESQSLFGEEVESIPVENPQQQGTKRRITSDVWNHFKKKNIDGKVKAQCNYCGRLMAGASTLGMTHLKLHIAKSCPSAPKEASPSREGTNIRKQVLVKQHNRARSKGISSPSVFNEEDQKASRRDLARMVILHEYPLAIVDHYQSAPTNRDWEVAQIVCEKLGYFLKVTELLPDPIYKLMLLTFYFNKMYGSKANEEIDKVKNLLFELFAEYDLENIDRGVIYSQASSSTSTSSVAHEHDDTMRDYDLFKCNASKYPTLRRIARDILAIPMTTVASESAFSTSGRLLSPHCSRLHHDTLEAIDVWAELVMERT
uniref:BED-type domain-containing protein n=1 Tax=Quercus lobata TaxID=97700 RepID=A0A7N2QYP0_QUELO